MTASVPTIVATCGGLNPGRWTEAVYGPLLLHAIALAEVRGRAPRVAHLNTAGGDPRPIEGVELEAAREAGVSASHLRVFPHPNVDSVRSYLLEQDVVWVSGGSLANLLALWRLHGIDEALREAWQAGVVLAGGSAGAICWHTGGTTSSFGPDIAPLADGLGFVPFSLAVHWDSDAARRPVHSAAVASGQLTSGFALEEGVGVVYRGGAPQEPEYFVTERQGGRAYRIRAAVDAARRDAAEAGDGREIIGGHAAADNQESSLSAGSNKVAMDVVEPRLIA
ncbi:Type 1 glutamine amidotransferase-like domain-containing protein [Herbiconiux sp. UC225_62]|uniref:Type 1 glutamine amidotransferase-like domain-containing protein n=1 Tax=Herbiconiux sp. UC225_62 TaxID=3350168 RepID=UPI0036D2E359